MICDTKIIEIFCNLDDFMKEFETVLTKNSISDTSGSKKRQRKSIFQVAVRGDLDAAWRLRDRINTL